MKKIEADTMSNSTRESLAAKLREIADSNSDLFDTERDDLRSAADALAAAAAPVAQTDALSVWRRVVDEAPAYLRPDGVKGITLTEAQMIAIGSALEGLAAPVQPERTAEHHIALRKAHEIQSAADFFDARPRHDNEDRRHYFGAGFKRGFDAAEKVYAPALSQVDAPAQQPEPSPPSAVQAAQQVDEADQDRMALVAEVKAQARHWAHMAEIGNTDAAEKAERDASTAIDRLAAMAADQTDESPLKAQRKFDRDLFDADAFYAALGRAVKARGVKWKDVAAATGVSTTTLSRMSSGRQPDAASLAALSAWAGINPANYCPPAPVAQQVAAERRVGTIAHVAPPGFGPMTDAMRATQPPAQPAGEPAPARKCVEAPPFSVFDEFGKPADDRIQDYAHQQVQRAIESRLTQPKGRV